MELCTKLLQRRSCTRNSFFCKIGFPKHTKGLNESQTFRVNITNKKYFMMSFDPFDISQLFQPGDLYYKIQSWFI